MNIIKTLILLVTLGLMLTSKNNVHEAIYAGVFSLGVFIWSAERSICKLLKGRYL